MNAFRHNRRRAPAEPAIPRCRRFPVIMISQPQTVTDYILKATRAVANSHG
jgi:hypothetical protein